MAEEILKDEIMSDDELDNVAGGYYQGYGADKEFLRSIGFKIGSSSDSGAYRQLFKDCLGKVGVTLTFSKETEFRSGSGGFGVENVTFYIPHYSINGKEVTNNAL